MIDLSIVSPIGLVVAAVAVGLRAQNAAGRKKRGDGGYVAADDHRPYAKSGASDGFGGDGGGAGGGGD